MTQISVRPPGSSHEPGDAELAKATADAPDTPDAANPLDSVAALTELRQCEEWWCEARDLHADNRVQMQLDHDYYDNLQWSDEEKAVMLARGQAPLVYNKLAQAIDWITGTERRTRIDFSVHARSDSGVDDAQNKAKLLKYLSDVNRIGWHRSRAFKDAVIGGEGWAEQSLRGDNAQELVMDTWVPWNEIWRDPFDKSMDLDGSRYLHRRKYLDLEFAIAIWPGRENVLRSAARSHVMADDDWFEETLDLPQCFRRYDSNGSEVVQRRWSSQLPITGTTSRLRVPITETWFRKPRRMKKIWGLDWGGTEHDATDPAQAEAVAKGYASLSDGLTTDIFVHIWVPGGSLQMQKSPFKHGSFPYTPVFAKRRSRDGMSYGVIRGSRDAQDDFNKRKSKTQWLLASNQFFYEESALDEDNLPDIRKNLARPNGEIKLNDGALQLNKVKIERNVELAEAQEREAERDAQHIHDGTGVNRELLGQQTNAMSGRAIRAKQDEGGVSTAELYDNLRLFVQLSGEKDLCNAEQFMTLPMQIRIEGEKGSQRPDFLSINQPEVQPDGTWGVKNDITKMAADFVVDEVDFRESIRQQQAEQLFDMLKTLPPEIQINFLDLALEMTDITNRKEWAKRARTISGQPDPENQDDPQALAEQQERDAAKAQKQAAADDQTNRMTEATIARTHAQAAKDNATATSAVATAKEKNLNSKVRSMDIAKFVHELLPLAPSADRVYQGTTAEG